MKNVLIISGHTNLSASVANKTILDTVHKLLPEVEIVKLDELYPDFRINVEVEQQRLLKADIIVLEFPVFWYSAPSSMYSHDGPMGYTIDEFLPCFKATCNLCQMEFAGYVYTGGVSYAYRTTRELIEQQNKISVEHAEHLIKLIESL